MMKGLLTDVNLQGLLPAIRRQIDADFREIFDFLNIKLSSFADLGIPEQLDDQSLWLLCQNDGWVLLTENRNQAEPTSLQTTLDQFWSPGQLPVLTLANKSRFQLNREHFIHTVRDIADLLLDIHDGKSCDQPRIYVPRRWV